VQTVRAQSIGSRVGISDEKLQELRDRVDLVAVVQRRVQLSKSGRDWKGLCPFHGEKTASFYVVPDKRIFHCFGCGATGDAIKFVMDLEGKGFREAIEGLATEVGLELAPQDPAEAKRSARRAVLAEVNEKACRFYERVLHEHALGAIAREHLEERGIATETAKAWRLGYAPNRWDALSKSLARDKVDPRLAEEAGLLVPRQKSKGLYDRFRGRLMIPIREGGRTVAFGGRLLEGESQAKYMNSPESPLYTKGDVLFALDKSREAIRREGTAAFVEGYFDAIGLHQAGIPIAVATCGTALTQRHLDLVARAQARELIFVFDGDEAGRRAATRAAELAAAAGISARVLVPPRGEDPDETVRRIGTEAFRELLAHAQPALEYLLDGALAALGPEASIEARVRTVNAVRGIVQAAPAGLSRELYVEKVAEKLRAPAETVRMALEGNAPERKPARAAVEKPAAAKRGSDAPPRLAAKVELQILAQMLQGPELCRAVDSSGAAARFTVAALRELAERAFDGARKGSLDAEALAASAEPERLRTALQRERAEVARGKAERLEDELKALQLKLAKHQRLSAQEAALRQGAREPKVPKPPP